MLTVVVLSAIVLGSIGVSIWSWRKLGSLDQRSSGGPALRAWPLGLSSTVPVLAAGAVLTWRSSLSGRAAIEFFVAYAAVAYPLLLWTGYLLMRIARRSSGRVPK